MGYEITQRGAVFGMQKENFEPCLQAIKALADRVQFLASGENSMGDRWYSWVNTEKFVSAKTLEEALEEWGWEIQLAEDGDAYFLQFVNEKLGDDEVLLNAIAPYVEDGSYIEIAGEDADWWRWVFKGGKMFEITPEITWPEPQEITE